MVFGKTRGKNAEVKDNESPWEEKWSSRSRRGIFKGGSSYQWGGVWGSTCVSAVADFGGV